MACKRCNVVKWLYPIVLLLLCACTPQQRMARLIRKHPELLKTDTIWKEHITKEISKDTVFSHSETRDTIVLRKDKLTVKYFYSKDTVYLYGKCDPDTVRYPVYRDRITIQEKQTIPSWIWWVIVFASCIIVIQGIRLMLRLSIH